MFSRFLLGALLIIGPYTARAYANICERLTQATKITVPTGLQLVKKTGDEFMVKLHVEVTDPSLSKELPPELPFSLFFANGISGSAVLRINATLQPEQIFHGGQDIDATIVIPPNLVGRYTLNGQHLLYLPVDERYCLPSRVELPQAFVDIYPKDPSMTDISAPVVTDLDLPLGNFPLGAVIRLEIKAFDASGLCTYEQAQAGKCQDGRWHLAFHANDGHIVDVFPSCHYDQERDLYYADFPLDEKDENGTVKFSRGTYQMLLHDVTDIWGNTQHMLPQIFERKVRIM